MEYQYFNLYQVYHPDIVDILSMASYITATISITLTSLLVFVVFFKSPKAMKKFKWLLLLILVGEVGLNFALILTNPRVISKYFILSSYGLLEKLMGIFKYIRASSELMSIIFIFGIAATVAISCVILIVLSILYLDRYMVIAMEGPLTTKNFYKHILFYFILYYIIFMPVGLYIGMYAAPTLKINSNIQPIIKEYISGEDLMG